MERILRLEDIRNCSSSPIHCVAQTGNLYNCKRISLRSGMKNDLVYLGSDHQLYKIQDYEVLWEHLLQNSSFLFSFFFFFFYICGSSHLKVNDLSTTITTTKKPWFSCVFPGEWKQTQGGEGGKERLVLLNFSLRVTLAPRVRLALSSVSLEKYNIDTCSAVYVIFRERYPWLLQF